MIVNCPKCGHTRTAEDDPAIPDYQCPACGIVYQKYIALHLREVDQEKGRLEELQQEANEIKEPVDYKDNFHQDQLGEGLRRRALLAGVILFVLYVGIKFYPQIIAKVEGFEDATERTKALSLGIDNKSDFDAHVAKKKKEQEEYRLRNMAKIKARRQADRERKLADKEDKREALRAKKEECELNIHCKSNNMIATVGLICDNQVEKLAKYSIKWTDAWYEPKFSRYKIKDFDRRIVAFYGDKVQFQNGFGAMQNMVYECDIAVDSNTVVGVSASPGRL